MARYSTREKRTRGPDPDNPVNKPGPDTPGFTVPRRRRVRPSTLDGDERRHLIEKLNLLSFMGATDFDIALVLGVSVDTIGYWRGAYPDLAEAMRIPAEAANERVERALYHRAKGYSFPSEKIFQHEGQVIRVPTIEHVPPDPKAIEMWLYNRSDKWRGLKEQLITAKVETEAPDPRKLAMAMVALLRDAAASRAAEPQQIEGEHADVSRDED
jgi:hypothetical protein